MLKPNVRLQQKRYNKLKQVWLK